jgi:hypothetical protein
MNYCTLERAHSSVTSVVQALPASARIPTVSGTTGLNVTRKKKLKRFRAVTAVKELARERVGAPPAGKIVVEKKKKPERHKPTLSKLLNDSE